MIRRVLLAVALLQASIVSVAAAPYVIEIDNMKFGAAPEALKAGDVITWKNNDILRHTATARNGDFDVVLAPGASATVTLKTAGIVTVLCRYHPNMTLRLDVAD